MPHFGAVIASHELWLSSLCNFNGKLGKTWYHHVSPGLSYYASCWLDALRLASAF